MQREMNDTEVALGGVVIYAIGLCLIWVKTWQIRRTGRSAQVLDADGTARDLSEEERRQLVLQLSRERGKHLWQIVVIGIVLMITTIVVLKQLFPGGIKI